MSAWINIGIVAVALCVGACLVVLRPYWVDDSNLFLKGFVGSDFLNLLGVFLAISLASLSQVHLAMGRLKEQSSEESIATIKREVRSSAVWLIWLFLASIMVIIVKPIFADCVIAQAIANVLCVWILIFYILVLSDITMAVFDIDFPA